MGSMFLRHLLAVLCFVGLVCGLTTETPECPVGHSTVAFPTPHTVCDAPACYKKMAHPGEVSVYYCGRKPGYRPHVAPPLFLVWQHDFESGLAPFTDETGGSDPDHSVSVVTDGTEVLRLDSTIGSFTGGGSGTLAAMDLSGATFTIPTAFQVSPIIPYNIANRNPERISFRFKTGDCDSSADLMLSDSQNRPFFHFTVQRNATEGGDGYISVNSRSMVAATSINTWYAFEFDIDFEARNVTTGRLTVFPAQTETEVFDVIPFYNVNATNLKDIKIANQNPCQVHYDEFKVWDRLSVDYAEYYADITGP